MSLWRGLITIINNNIDVLKNYHGVPTVGGADNSLIRDVVGNKGGVCKRSSKNKRSVSIGVHYGNVNIFIK